MESDVWLRWLGAKVTEFMRLVLFGQVCGSNEGRRSETLDNIHLICKPQ